MSSTDSYRIIDRFTCTLMRLSLMNLDQAITADKKLLKHFGVPGYE